MRGACPGELEYRQLLENYHRLHWSLYKYNLYITSTSLDATGMFDCCQNYYLLCAPGYELLYFRVIAVRSSSGGYFFC